MERFWKPHMTARGFSLAAFTCKTGATAEGCALFVRDSRLTVLHVQQLRLRVVGAETLDDDDGVQAVGGTMAGGMEGYVCTLTPPEPRGVGTAVEMILALCVPRCLLKGYFLHTQSFWQHHPQRE
jgi:hypothetical protein